jgi:hypothetical protein
MNYSKGAYSGFLDGSNHCISTHEVPGSSLTWFKDNVAKGIGKTLTAANFEPFDCEENVITLRASIHTAPNPHNIYDKITVYALGGCH